MLSSAQLSRCPFGGVGDLEIQTTISELEQERINHNNCRMKTLNAEYASNERGAPGGSHGRTNLSVNPYPEEVTE